MVCMYRYLILLWYEGQHADVLAFKIIIYLFFCGFSEEEGELEEIKEETSFFCAFSKNAKICVCKIEME